MNFVIDRTSLYRSLQKVISVISGRPRMPILSNLLLEVNDNYLFITVTDLEIEIIVQVLLEDKYPSGSSTVPGRKFYEICRSFPESSRIFITSKDDKLIICSGSSKFSLSTFSSSDFPKLEEWDNEKKLVISENIFKKMIELTQFSMGNQDARYYLNGVFFKTQEHIVRIVATDGHRLASCEVSMESFLPDQSVIIPRKGIAEILHLLNIKGKLINIKINNNSIRIESDNYIFTSKLVDAVFPNYSDVFCKQPKNILEVSCDILKYALKRVAILSNERLRIVKFTLSTNHLKITACNAENEKSEEILDVLYSGQDMEVSFNVNYLLDVLHVMDKKCILQFFFTNEVSGVQIEDISKRYGAVYVVMPIRV